jgi:hypothetical protein
MTTYAIVTNLNANRRPSFLDTPPQSRNQLSTSTKTSPKPGQPPDTPISITINKQPLRTQIHNSTPLHFTPLPTKPHHTHTPEEKTSHVDHQLV